VLCTDKTGTLTQNRMTVVELWHPVAGNAGAEGGFSDPAHLSLLEVSALASAPVPIDPMEVAFHAAARDAGIAGRDQADLVQTYGLRPDLLAMSNIWQSQDASAPLTVAAKGAPEAISKLCRLEPDVAREVENATQALAARGMRVLGIALAETVAADSAKPLETYQFRLLGLAGLADPLRAGVPDAIGQCRAAGIRVVMITGDYPATAKAIAAQAGLAEGKLMTGDEVAQLGDEALALQVSQVSVFARTMPEQKLRIVSALKAAGEIVAMTGDGVNDAPALKAAHIGVAMGKRGTDVAREAAAIVLVEDDFGAIVSAIRVGRRIYDNIRKALGFIFGVHVPIAGLAILPVALGLPPILGPLQIALLEMVIDPICALVFEAEREESDIMLRPPRNTKERIFALPIILRGVAQGGLALIVIALLYLGANYWGTGPDVLRTLAFFALLAATLALVLANRSFSTSLGHALVRNNAMFRYVLAVICTGIALILAVPGVRNVLKFTPLGLPELSLVAATGLIVLIGSEFIKASKSFAPRAEARMQAGPVDSKARV
jgi:Ca2+-transporting ATPase